MSQYYDREGKKIDLIGWAELMNNPGYKIIKQESTPSGLWVSTVWLGLDHQYGDGEPLIFETMVFPSKGNFQDLDQARYSTKEEAIKGHEEMLNKHNN